MEFGPVEKTVKAFPWESAAQPSRSGESPLAVLKSPDKSIGRAKSFVAVIGHGPMLEREEGAAFTLRQLGATVRTLDLWDDPLNLIRPADETRGVRPRALVFEALDRPDLGVVALRTLRKESVFDGVGAI